MLVLDHVTLILRFYWLVVIQNAPMVAHVTMADVYAQQESRAQPVTKVFKEHLVVVKLRSCAEYQKYLQFEKKINTNICMMNMYISF